MGNGVAGFRLSNRNTPQAYAPQAFSPQGMPSLLRQQPTYAQFNPQGRYGLLAQQMAGPGAMPTQPQTPQLGGLLGGGGMPPSSIPGGFDLQSLLRNIGGFGGGIF